MTLFGGARLGVTRFAFPVTRFAVTTLTRFAFTTLARLALPAAPLAATTSAVARPLARAVFARLLAIAGGFGVHREVTLGTRDRLPDQAFDRGNRLAIERGDDRD